MKNLRKNHHYVSQSYLKTWANNHNRVWTYRTLVSHSSVPEWFQSSIKIIANHHHLFTRSILGADSDEIEVWMDQEIETPAQIALTKARSDEPLSKQEWEHLLRFVALQDIRNPERYIQQLERWKLEMPTIIEEAMQTTLSKMKADPNEGLIPANKEYIDSKLIPIRVTKENGTASELGQLKTEVLLGRGVWLFSIRHLLTTTYKVLNEHTWSILRSPGELLWVTSDNPLVRLNYYEDGSYDFKGGWGNKGAEIIFPLSPRLLLYTQVGNKVRMNNVTRELAETLNRFIAENAHRHIFGLNPVDEISEIYPRIVNQVAYDHEKKEWETWHVRQKKLEQEY
ncbi:DUF4238 domain-containing protein [Paenibacillus sp. FSL R5-0475]|uniref:DUF4238 domain-containing protein n=1 Tax=Paenibacillus sp. FSL R5-0475 TaxID=2921643 RepID=UPI0030FA867F